MENTLRASTQRQLASTAKTGLDLIRKESEYEYEYDDEYDEEYGTEAEGSASRLTQPKKSTGRQSATSHNKRHQIDQGKKSPEVRGTL